MAPRQSGEVIWFNAKKGYGWINCDNQKENAYVHYMDIVTDGFKTLTNGARVKFSLIKGKGSIPRAVKVTQIKSTGKPHKFTTDRSTPARAESVPPRSFKRTRAKKEKKVFSKQRTSYKHGQKKVSSKKKKIVSKEQNVDFYDDLEKESAKIIHSKEKKVSFKKSATKPKKNATPKKAASPQPTRRKSPRRKSPRPVKRSSSKKKKASIKRAASPQSAQWKPKAVQKSQPKVVEKKEEEKIEVDDDALSAKEEIVEVKVPKNTGPAKVSNFLEELQFLEQKMADFSMKYDENTLDEMYETDPDWMNIEQSLINTEMSAKWLHTQLAKIKKLRPQLEEYKQWNINTTMAWIKSLDNGYFRQYCDMLRAAFESDGITAADLPCITRSDLATTPFEIRSFKDRKSLAEHFKALGEFEQKKKEKKEADMLDLDDSDVGYAKYLKPN